MFLFIAIIFIAELIIVWTLVSWILKVDKSVLALQKDFEVLNPQLKTVLTSTREEIHQVKEKKDSFIDMINNKSTRYIVSALLSGVLYLAIFIVRRKSKKIAQIFQGILVAKELWDNLSA